jgi:hypothetical protein
VRSCGASGEEIGGDCGYRQAGYLWLASNQRELDALAAGRAVQHAEGLHEAVAVRPDEIALRGVPVDPAGSWAGLYEMSPDKHAILGAAPGCENFFLVNGSSGHGVMHAPALGHLLAEIILDGRATTIDATPLRPTRFAEGDLNPVSELL